MTNLDKFRAYADQLESPARFITWNFYSMISLTLGRKVWLQNLDFNPIFPNLFICYVAPPGIGKSQACSAVKRILEGIEVWQAPATQTAKGGFKPLINWAPTNVTVEKFTGMMADKTKIETMIVHGKERDYASCEWVVFLEEELASFFSKNTDDLALLITALYNGGNYSRATILHGTQEIKNACLNLVGCAVPEWVAQNFTNAMLSNGFASRLFLIYDDRPGKRIGIGKYTEKHSALQLELRNFLKKLSGVRGELAYTQEACDYIEHWSINLQDDRGLRANSDPILDSYYARRKVHWLKLAMSMHFSESLEMELTVDDLKRADVMLRDAEVRMSEALCKANQHPFAKMVDKVLMLLEAEKGICSKKKLKAMLITMSQKEDFGNSMDPDQTIDKVLAFLKEGGRVTMKDNQVILQGYRETDEEEFKL